MYCGGVVRSSPESLYVMQTGENLMLNYEFCRKGEPNATFDFEGLSAIFLRESFKIHKGYNNRWTAVGAHSQGFDDARPRAIPARHNCSRRNRSGGIS